MKTSCGIILTRDGKYLLGHTNGGGSNAWTILKGVRDEGETEETAAYREFKEETGIDLKALGLPITRLSSYKMRDKMVVVFLCKDDNELTAQLVPKCSSMVRPDYPEIDYFKWVTKEVAHGMVFNSQQHLFA